MAQYVVVKVLMLTHILCPLYFHLKVKGFAFRKKVPLFKAIVSPYLRECVISTEARHERSGEILLLGLIVIQNGKISPLQNLLRQIFPVEMTHNQTCGYTVAFKKGLRKS